MPAGSYRLWPESHSSYALGMYQSSTFRSQSAGLHLPQVFKMYGIYLGIYLFLVLADRFGSGEWHFG